MTRLVAIALLSSLIGCHQTTAPKPPSKSYGYVVGVPPNRKDYVVVVQAAPDIVAEKSIPDSGKASEMP